jgi:penicillin-binding protein 2
LWLAVNGAGTAGRGRIAGRDVSGKTGTAQVISLEGRDRARGKTDRNLNDHGWFVFMAPKDDPEVAGVIFVEHAEHGYFGATVAKHILETYFAQRDGLPLPELKVPAPATPPPARAVTATATAGPAGGTR